MKAGGGRCVVILRVVRTTEATKTAAQLVAERLPPAVRSLSRAVSLSEERARRGVEHVNRAQVVKDSNSH